MRTQIENTSTLAREMMAENKRNDPEPNWSQIEAKLKPKMPITTEDTTC
jgi:hypothetical protein